MWAYEPGKIDVAYIITMLIIRDLLGQRRR